GHWEDLCCVQLTLCLTRLCALSSVSQHALCGVVEVTVGSQSVLLPCHYSGIVPEEPVVTWTTGDVGPACVHLRREQDDLRTQHERYRGRTRMQDLLRTGDLSLTLRFPTAWDRGRYVCTVYRGEDVLSRAVVLQHVTGQRGTGTLSGVRPRNAPPAGNPEVHPDRLMG
uniref:Ig-like domain-containing protein n=1 Tax=Xiphophorus maculatus TaxID=8083 RepID=A0A3B5Q693_XIPMA